MMELIMIPSLYELDLVSILPMALATLFNRNKMQTTYESEILVATLKFF